MPIENDFTRVFSAIKELEERVEALELGSTVEDDPWCGEWEPDYKALFESEQFNAGRLLKELNSEVIKREELESVKLYFAALADRYELSAAQKTEQIKQLKALNEEHLKTIAELVAALAPTVTRDLTDGNNYTEALYAQNNQLRFVLSILAAVKDDGWIEWHGSGTALHAVGRKGARALRCANGKIGLLMKESV
jgi:hypothetical protein